MGAEQSTEAKRKEDERYQRMMKFALEQQRKLYEEKCKELLKEQQKSKAATGTPTANPQNAFQNTLVSQTQANYAPLYPNLQQNTAVVNAQASMSSAYNLAHSSNTPNQKKSILNPVQVSPVVYSTTSNAACNPFTASAPIQHSPSSIASFDCQPTAPIALEAGTSSQQKHRTNTKNKKSNDLYPCPSCKMNSLGNNIFQCQQGHSSCNQCKMNGVKCGVCRSLITNTRNIELERIIANLEINTNIKITERINCPNKSDGCSLSFKPENMEAHMKECLFREMECPLSPINYCECSWRGKINQIQAHFLECHPDQTGANVDREMSFDRSNNTVIHLITMGKFNFLVHVKQDRELQAFVMTVQLIGSLVSATKWTYEIHVYDKSEPRRKFTYVDTCLPNSIPLSDVSKEGKCAVLPIQYFLSFLKNEKVTYKFYIKRELKKRPNQLFNKTSLVQSEA